MRIIANQDILQRQSDNYIRGELSNIAAVVQSPQIMVDYFSIDPDDSTTVNGLKNIEDFIGPTSTVVYNEIENLPMSGIQELVIQSQYDDELGHDEDFQSEGIIFPNTIVPKEDDCFLVKGNKYLALYKVIQTEPVTSRSNPFIGITFRLFSRDPILIQQLRRQVKDVYVTSVTSLGADKTLVIKKSNYFKLEHHVTQYIEILDLYKELFYDHRRSAFIYNGIADENGDIWSFLDLILWKIMFDSRVGLYDQVVTYGINNYNIKTDRIYGSTPEAFLDMSTVRRSILWRIINRRTNVDIAEFKYPQVNEPDPRIGKFTGKFLYYFESYGKECDCNLMCTTCPVWDDDFVYRIKNNILYDEPTPEEYERQKQQEESTCCTPVEYVNGSQVNPYNGNVFLRNVVIKYYNKVPIDFDSVILEQKITSDNYYLIPILLVAYQEYLEHLQK